MEAAFEIAKQIKLRNLSGKIVIDFAGVSEYRYLKNVIEVLEQELQKDYVKARFRSQPRRKRGNRQNAPPSHPS